MAEGVVYFQLLPVAEAGPEVLLEQPVKMAMRVRVAVKIVMPVGEAHPPGELPAALPFLFRMVRVQIVMAFPHPVPHHSVVRHATALAETLAVVA
jgi:hypothetical protein